MRLLAYTILWLAMILAAGPPARAQTYDPKYPVALAELDRGFSDQRFQVRLALDQRQLPQVVTIEIKQVERDHEDFA